MEFHTGERCLALVEEARVSVLFILQFSSLQEKPVLAAALGAQASLNKARLHSCTQKRERHYQIDSSLRSGQVAHQPFMVFPGGHSLAFSGLELIKVRGDGKAMLSL